MPPGSVPLTLSDSSVPSGRFVSVIVADSMLASSTSVITASVSAIGVAGPSSVKLVA